MADPISTAVGVASSVLSALPSGSSLGDLAKAAAGNLTEVLPVAGNDDQFLDSLAVVGAGSAQPALLALWKANFNKVYMTPAWLTFFAERGLVSNPAAPTKADKQFVCLFALAVSGSPKKARTVEETWLGNRESLRSESNRSVLTEWGVIG